MKKAAVLCFGLIFFACFMPVFGQASFNDALLPGLEAYAREDWATSIMLFKKATNHLTLVCSLIITYYDLFVKSFMKYFLLEKKHY